MSILKNLARMLLGGAKRQSSSKRKAPAASSNAPTSKQTRPPSLVRDFLDLTDGEGALICELVGGEYISGDSRMTALERLVDAVESDGEDTSAFLLDYWEKNAPIAIEPLVEKLRPLTGRQSRAVMSAARKVWKAGEEDDLSDHQRMVNAGML